ncbi:MAG: YitT family protein [Ferruginibacter sp.]
MQYDEVYRYMMNILETQLPDDLSYHNVSHTKTVIAAVEHLAEKEKITGNDLLLLKTAALFHDTGFLVSNQEHENLSCNTAMKELPVFGYSAAQIDSICRMIRATKVPQSPKDQLSKLLCDADLLFLGGEHYAEISENLFKENRQLGIVTSQAEWDAMQVSFLSAHQYFTDTAINECEEKKQAVLRSLESRAAANIKSGESFYPVELVQDILLMVAGVLISAFALSFFLVPNKLIDGGITGIYLLMAGSLKFNPTLLIILLNLPFVIIGYFTVSPRFALWTLISVVLLGVTLYFFHTIHIKPFSDDKLLMSVFGGVFLGLGIGLVMRAGAALDGIEVLALYTLKRSSFTITEIILGINIIIFSVAAYIFSVETAFYSILTYFAATRTIDYVVEGIQAHTGVTIISGKSEMIKYQLVNNLGRGITVYKGERGFLPGQFEVSSDCDIIFTVINRLELRKLKNLVYRVDPKAFVFANTIKEASGGIIKRRHTH